MNMRPGASRPFCSTSSGGMSSTPTSEASTTSPLRVTTQRPGRRPFLSRMAPTFVPSLKAMAAGPSQGSITAAWYS